MNLTTLTFLLVAAGPAQYHSSPACWDEPRNFHQPFDREFDQRFTTSHANPSEASDTAVYSPNGAYWFEIVEPDHSTADWKPGSLRIHTERAYQLEIAFRDVKAFHEARWINEKLIFVAPWWGRVLGSHLILDVEKEVFVWKEMVVWGGDAFQQFQAACQQPDFRDDVQCQCDEQS